MTMLSGALVLTGSKNMPQTIGFVWFSGNWRTLALLFMIDAGAINGMHLC
ncbi:MAG: hypothetical protein AAFV45_14470 [Pseudomonadota bacterium]